MFLSFSISLSLLILFFFVSYTHIEWVLKTQSHDITIHLIIMRGGSHLS